MKIKFKNKKPAEEEKLAKEISGSLFLHQLFTKKQNKKKLCGTQKSWLNFFGKHES